MTISGNLHNPAYMELGHRVNNIEKSFLRDPKKTYRVRSTLDTKGAHPRVKPGTQVRYPVYLGYPGTLRLQGT